MLYFYLITKLFMIKNNLDLPKNSIINSDVLIFVSKNILTKKKS